MGKETGVRWMVILGIYFFVMTIFLTALEGHTSSYDELTDNEFLTSDGGVSSYLSVQTREGGVCDYPKVNPQNDWKIVQNSCEDLLISNPTECNPIQNCEWVNETIQILWFDGYLGDAYCKGNVNVSVYNEGVPIAGDKICYASELDDQQELCQTMGCTWWEYNDMTREEIDQYIGIGGGSRFVASLGFITGVRADFGLSGLALLITSFFFFWLPLILLIGAIWVAIFG